MQYKVSDLEMQKLLSSIEQCSIVLNNNIALYCKQKQTFKQIFSIKTVKSNVYLAFPSFINIIFIVLFHYFTYILSYIVSYRTVNAINYDNK